VNGLFPYPVLSSIPVRACWSRAAACIRTFGLNNNSKLHGLVSAEAEDIFLIRPQAKATPLRAGNRIPVRAQEGGFCLRFE
jgi:hypothetical protein